MTGRACVRLSADASSIYASTDKNINKPHDILVYIVDLDNWIKTDIVTLNKDRGDVLSEFCTEISKAIFLWNVNEVIF